MSVPEELPVSTAENEIEGTSFCGFKLDEATESPQKMDFRSVLNSYTNPGTNVCGFEALSSRVHMMWKFGQRVSAHVPYSSFDHDSKLRGCDNL
ncbi:hypothetical protein TNCV_3208111 [Trichonephila clavipes]|nr:hypothetical protein TNCV_3208111 [Trichonephila clavipes]